MSDKPFPPSGRRIALARQAGLTAASPVLVGGMACAAVVIALVYGRFALGASIADAVASAGRDTAGFGDAAIARDVVSVGHSLTSHVLAIAVPILLAAAIAALLAQVAQTRTLWLPRRRIEGAPAVDGGSLARVRSTAFELGSAVVIGGVVFGWLWIFAPRIATLVEQEPRGMLAGFASLAVSALAAVAIAWIALGILDALTRQLALANALRMTASEKKEDDRRSAADPRWARARSLLDRAPEGEALSNLVAGSSVVVIGDDTAVVIAWDALRRPIPTRIAVGRRARATQLIGLARRHRIAVHRAPELARVLVGEDGPVPEVHWRALAEVLAATRGGSSA
ncbi:MAG: EscU/YscU/HrcU family type III secretion system export apparatus switch protein [Kofleriaceae bacterium]